MPAYNRDDIHKIVSKIIPPGKVTCASHIASAMGLDPCKYQRAVGGEVCKCKKPDKYRVLLKSKHNKPWCFPHWDNDPEDTRQRAEFLRKEKILISDDGTRVLNIQEFLWDFNERVARREHKR